MAGPQSPPGGSGGTAALVGGLWGGRAALVWGHREADAGGRREVGD